MFFSLDPKKGGWKVVLQKEPRGKRIINKVQVDPKDFDMFRIELAGIIVGLQTPQPIEEIIQPINVIRGCPIRATDVVVLDDSDDARREDEM